ncbi:helix-turn-helix transcriptional regulator [Verrucomicrobium sp. BvORR106]|uniref:helix-turn-helix transcriptional regulator n=1 Tax=Verrucomicrobium sp. BvORR106 TaxID=1403819 RepID=UPI000571719C|nr:helix-turn-helix transcriptional regulator [Verrucomicrobium sp. BvORR106]
MKNQLKVERARHNLTQQDLADAVEVSRQTIHAIETGKFVPSTVLALKLARRFAIRVEELFALEEGD